MAKLSNRKIAQRKVSINRNIKNISKSFNLEDSTRKQLEANLRERFNNNKGFFKLRNINKQFKNGKFYKKTARNQIRSLLGNQGYRDFLDNAKDIGININDIKGSSDDSLALALGTHNLFYRENKDIITKYNNLRNNKNKIREFNIVSSKLKKAQDTFNNLKEQNLAKQVAKNIL